MQQVDLEILTQVETCDRVLTAVLGIDYSLSNPDTLTKYKTAAQITHKVLEAVTGWCVDGAKILTLCEKGDKLLDEEVGKVYKGKKISKGSSPYLALRWQC